MSLQCPSENQPANGKFVDVRGTYIRIRSIKKARKPSYTKGLRAIRCGAGGGGRTRTVLPPRDFESRTSASSITPACYSNSITDWFGFFNCFFRPGQNFFFPFSVFPQKNGCFLSHCMLYYTTSIIGLAVPQKRYARPAGRKDGAYEKSLCHHRTGAGYFRHGGRRDCGGFQLSGHETAPCSVI